MLVLSIIPILQSFSIMVNKVNKAYYFANPSTFIKRTANIRMNISMLTASMRWYCIKQL